MSRTGPQKESSRQHRSKPTLVPGRIPRFLLAAIIIALLTAVTYSNSLNNGFVWDDEEQIVINPNLRLTAPIVRLFSSDVWGFRSAMGRERGNYYRPLQMCAYRLTQSLAGPNPFAFHLLSLLTAVASSLAAFILFWQLTRSIALAFSAAAVFAVHPVHSEAVDWASSLPDIGCTLFVLLAFVCLLLVDAKALSKRSEWACRGAFLGSLLCFACALLWKEPAAAFPVLVFLYYLMLSGEPDLWRRARFAVRRSVAYWIVLGGYVVVRVAVLGHFAIRQRRWQLSFFQYCLTAVKLLMSYCWKLIVPLNLNAYHVFVPARSALWVFTAVLFVAAIALACIYAFRRLPLASFAFVWVLVTLLPVLNIYALGRNVFAERYLYLPSVGFCLLVVVLVAQGLRLLSGRYRPYVGCALLVATVGAFAAETVARNPDWKDNATLFERTLEQSPDAPFVQNMVAASLATNDAASAAAEMHYSLAISLAAREQPPDYLQMARAEEGLATIFAERADFQKAITSLEQVRALNPCDPEVDAEEGLILARAERWQEAERYLTRAAASSRENENVLNALGIVAWQYHRNLDAAAEDFRKAIAIHALQDDFSASLHDNLGAVYGEQGKMSDAIQEFRSAISMDAHNPDYHTNLAQALLASGDSQQANAEIQAALQLEPGYGPALVLKQEMRTLAGRR